MVTRKVKQSKVVLRKISMSSRGSRSDLSLNLKPISSFSARAVMIRLWYTPYLFRYSITHYDATTHHHYTVLSPIIITVWYHPIIITVWYHPIIITLCYHPIPLHCDITHHYIMVSRITSSYGYNPYPFRYGITPPSSYYGSIRPHYIMASPVITTLWYHPIIPCHRSIIVFCVPSLVHHLSIIVYHVSSTSPSFHLAIYRTVTSPCTVSSTVLSTAM